MGDKKVSKRLRRWGLTGAFVAFGGFFIWSGADLLVGRTISRFSPQIEETLSNSLGHPLKIGAYRGLRPWGVALGRTKLLPGEKDSSSVNIWSPMAEVSVSIIKRLFKVFSALLFNLKIKSKL